MNRKKTAGTVAALTVMAVTLAAVIYIMLHGSGLQEGLDFGAGAYYYADIPDFEKYLKWDSFKEGLPYWVSVRLLLKR